MNENLCFFPRVCWLYLLLWLLIEYSFWFRELYQFTNRIYFWKKKQIQILERDRERDRQKRSSNLTNVIYTYILTPSLLLLVYSNTPNMSMPTINSIWNEKDQNIMRINDRKRVMCGCSCVCMCLFLFAFEWEW